MQTITEVVTAPGITNSCDVKSNYKGSPNTYKNVKEQIRLRYGPKCAKEFDPYKDAMTFAIWLSQGYKVKKGEKCLKSITFLEVKDKETGKVLRKVKRSVNLFHKKQVEKV